MNLPLTDKWLDHFMGLARFCASMSKDPSTKVGAVIVRPDRTVAGTGFNGYPMQVRDDNYDNRERKYQRVVHAEMNAILNVRGPVDGYTLFVWPIPPCERCAPHILQSGIGRVVIPSVHGSHPWSGSAAIAEDMFNEAGIHVVTWDIE